MIPLLSILCVIVGYLIGAIPFGLLVARGFRITKAARERIARCTDAKQLDRWVRRAAVVRKVGEMFDEG